jgi:hypothetical protein
MTKNTGYSLIRLEGDDYGIYEANQHNSCHNLIYHTEDFRKALGEFISLVCAEDVWEDDPEEDERWYDEEFIELLEEKFPAMGDSLREANTYFKIFKVL